MVVLIVKELARMDLLGKSGDEVYHSKVIVCISELPPV